MDSHATKHLRKPNTRQCRNSAVSTSTSSDQSTFGHELKNSFDKRKSKNQIYNTEIGRSVSSDRERSAYILDSFCVKDSFMDSNSSSIDVTYQPSDFGDSDDQSDESEDGEAPQTILKRPPKPSWSLRSRKAQNGQNGAVGGNSAYLNKNNNNNNSNRLSRESSKEDDSGSDVLNKRLSYDSFDKSADLFSSDGINDVVKEDDKSKDSVVDEESFEKYLKSLQKLSIDRKQSTKVDISSDFLVSDSEEELDRVFTTSSSSSSNSTSTNNGGDISRNDPPKPLQSLEIELINEKVKKGKSLTFTDKIETKIEIDTSEWGNIGGREEPKLKPKAEESFEKLNEDSDKENRSGSWLIHVDPKPKSTGKIGRHRRIHGRIGIASTTTKENAIKTQENITKLKKKNGLELARVASDSVVSFEENFLKSLSPACPDYKRHRDALIFLGKSFKRNREKLCTRLYSLYNDKVFEGRLPETMPIEWNARLRKTAGRCVYRRSANGDRGARVELSLKVCDSADRVRDTLIHELCHAAVWLLDGDIKGGHGPNWRYWATKAHRTFDDLPVITRCHVYEISAKFIYKCATCTQEIKRHSKSLDVERKVCGYCRGRFTLTVVNSTKQTKNNNNNNNNNNNQIITSNTDNRNQRDVKKKSRKTNQLINELEAQFRSLNT